MTRDDLIDAIAGTTPPPWADAVRQALDRSEHWLPFLVLILDGDTFDYEWTADPHVAFCIARNAGGAAFCVNTKALLYPFIDIMVREETEALVEGDWDDLLDG